MRKPLMCEFVRSHAADEIDRVRLVVINDETDGLGERNRAREGLRIPRIRRKLDDA
jgi:hypothetical protein